MLFAVLWMQMGWWLHLEVVGTPQHYTFELLWTLCMMGTQKPSSDCPCTPLTTKKTIEIHRLWFGYRNPSFVIWLSERYHLCRRVSDVVRGARHWYEGCEVCKRRAQDRDTMGARGCKGCERSRQGGKTLVQDMGTRGARYKHKAWTWAMWNKDVRHGCKARIWVQGVWGVQDRCEGCKRHGRKGVRHGCKGMQDKG